MSQFKLFLESENKDIDLIKKSIKNRNTILFYYEGDKNISRGYRWVEPVAFGYSKDGNGLLRAFQIKEKPSKSGHKPQWRLFRTDKISNVSASLRKFNQPRKGYNKTGDKAMKDLVINAVFKESILNEVRKIESESDYLDDTNNNHSEYNEVIDTYNYEGKFQNYDIYTSHMYGNSYDYIIVDKSKELVILSVAYEPVDGGIMSSSLWQNKTYTGLARSFYKFLLNKHSLIISDNRMTYRGFMFWDKITSQIGGEFGIYDEIDNEFVSKNSFNEMKEYWGDGEDYERWRYYIKKQKQLNESVYSDLYGWLLPNGKFISVDNQNHLGFLKILRKDLNQVMKQGWQRVNFVGDLIYSYNKYRMPSTKQLKYLKDMADMYGKNEIIYDNEEDDIHLWKRGIL